MTFHPDYGGQIYSLWHFVSTLRLLCLIEGSLTEFLCFLALIIVMGQSRYLKSVLVFCIFGSIFGIGILKYRSIDIGIQYLSTFALLGCIECMRCSSFLPVFAASVMQLISASLCKNG